MTKVKLVAAKSPSELESKVNNELISFSIKKVNDIKYQMTTIGEGNKVISRYTAMIIYEDK